MISGGDKHKVVCEEDQDDDPSHRDRSTNFFTADFSLRALSLALLVASLATTTTGNQVRSFGDASFPSEAATLDAKFTYSSAVIYFVVAVSVAILYTVLTAIVSATVIHVPAPSSGLLFFLAFSDALMAGVLASGSGAGASVAYIGLKGNDHIGWTKVCDIFDKFCHHIGSAIAFSLAASVVFVLLVGVSTYSLHRRSR